MAIACNVYTKSHLCSINNTGVKFLFELLKNISIINYMQRDDGDDD